MSGRAYGIALFGFGAALAVLGLALGQSSQVMAKAVMVCLECVGIG